MDQSDLSPANFLIETVVHLKEVKVKPAGHRLPRIVLHIPNQVIKTLVTQRLGVKDLFPAQGKDRQSYLGGLV